jgi:hypothetical protein
VQDIYTSLSLDLSGDWLLINLDLYWWRSLKQAPLRALANEQGWRRSFPIGSTRSKCLRGGACFSCRSVYIKEKH